MTKQKLIVANLGPLVYSQQMLININVYVYEQFQIPKGEKYSNLFRAHLYKTLHEPSVIHHTSSLQSE